jgi:hypothetical protein
MLLTPFLKVTHAETAARLDPASTVVCRIITFNIDLKKNVAFSYLKAVALLILTAICMVNKTNQIKKKVSKSMQDNGEVRS